MNHLLYTDQQADPFRHVCWLHVQFMINRYLMANAEGRWNGAEKAQRHAELCTFYVAALRGVEEAQVRRDFEDHYGAVHRCTQTLTDCLDDKIGFPLIGVPDYDTLAPLFFEQFHALALSACKGPGA